MNKMRIITVLAAYMAVFPAMPALAQAPETRTLQNLQYEYDALGNITRITDTSETDTAKTARYRYDDLSRLIEAAVNGAANGDNYTQNYTYSPTGNLIRHSAIGDYSYDGKHPQSVTEAGNVNYEYDARGNLTGDGTWTHEYDYRNRLVNSTNNGSEINYTYGYGNERIKKTDGENTTIYISDEYEIRDGVEIVHVFANGTRVATIRNGVIMFHHSDHLTGANVSTDEDGQVTEVADYYPYGADRIAQSNGTPADYRFTDQEKDSETGLYYYGARYYNPLIGRFLSRDPWQGDPADPQSLNKYSYARNNPIKYIDPSGEFPTMSETNRFMQGMTETVFWTGDVLTFGQFSNAFDRVEQAADRMITEGVNLKTVANTAYQVAYGAAANTLMALGMGGSAGELWMAASPLLLQKNIKQTNINPGSPAGQKNNSVLKYANENKIKHQMEKRGWNEQQIQEALQTQGIPAQGKINPATRFVHPETKKSVIIDNVTNEIFHVGKKNYKY